MRKLFMTDIHGEYTGMMKLLEYADFHPGVDQLVIGGDMVSRGRNSGPVLREVRKLALQYPEYVIALLGNHEEMMSGYFHGKDDMWLIHAGESAMPSLKKTFAKEQEFQAAVHWASTLPFLYEDDQYVYTHAGIVPHTPLMEQDRGVIWMTEDEFYAYPREEILERTGGKPVIHGHTPCEYIYCDGARMNCDLGAHSYSIQDEQALALVDLSNGV